MRASLFRSVSRMLKSKTGVPASIGSLGSVAGRAVMPPRARSSFTKLRKLHAASTVVLAQKTAEAPSKPSNKPDSSAPTPEDDAWRLIPLPTSDESEDFLRLRHSSAHIMAKAVQKLFPKAQVTIGPWIERGFYYDFDIPEPLTDDDLKKIKKEMQRIIKMDLPFRCETVTSDEARRRIDQNNEPYKAEILSGILAKDPNAPITIYHIGEDAHPEHWWDLCAGPHVESTGKINGNALDLESVAGAYWRGDETKQMLQRIYGTVWQTKDQLAAYKKMKEEAKRRDHRKLGQELDLFSIQDSAGGGLVFWHPNGAIIRHVIESFWKELHLKRGYQLIYSPHVAKVDLWKTSGHFDFYKENMFDQMQVEDEEYQLKPMNCPFHIAVYKDGYYSYRQLPIRWAELGTVYRYERSGTMHGLFRVRGFTQDDAHIFCLPSQIEAEIIKVLDLVEETLSTFGFSNYEINLSTKPEKSVGSDEIWARAEEALVGALQAKKWAYQVDAGGGAFYGPKIDIKILDAIGRKWQCSTIQLDFNLPQRFELEYVDEGNARQQPIMIHRAIFGSLERFFGILTENYAGAFPLWLAPTQVRILPITDSVLGYAEKVAESLREQGIRVQVDTGERINKLIRNAEKSKTPVMMVVGAKEAEEGTVSVRAYQVGDLGVMKAEEAVRRVKEAERTKAKNISA